MRVRRAIHRCVRCVRVALASQGQLRWRLGCRYSDDAAWDGVRTASGLGGEGRSRSFWEGFGGFSRWLSVSLSCLFVEAAFRLASGGAASRLVWRRPECEREREAISDPQQTRLATGMKSCWLLVLLLLFPRYAAQCAKNRNQPERYVCM